MRCIPRFSTRKAKVAAQSSKVFRREMNLRVILCRARVRPCSRAPSGCFAGARRLIRSTHSARLGNHIVHVKLGARGSDGVGVFEGVEDVERWEAESDVSTSHIPPEVAEQLVVTDRVVVRPAHASMRFGDALDRIQNPKSGDQASYYVEYTSLKGSFPQMLADFPSPSFADGLKLEHTNIWLGGHTLGKLHFDPFDNLMGMVKGSKTFDVFPPHHNEDLYEGHIREAELSYDQESGTFSRHKLQTSTAMVMSPVDMSRSDQDSERFPRFTQALRQKITCTVEEGDLLFLPSYWWHEVRSRPGESGLTFGINFWYEPFFEKEFPCPHCRLRFNEEEYAELIDETLSESREHSEL
eukprot:188427_1